MRVAFMIITFETTHGITIMLKHYVMPIHTKNGATVCTPDGFAMKQRIERLKRELRTNRRLNNI